MGPALPQPNQPCLPLSSGPDPDGYTTIIQRAALLGLTGASQSGTYLWLSVGEAPLVISPALCICWISEPHHMVSFQFPSFCFDRVWNDST